MAPKVTVPAPSRTVPRKSGVHLAQTPDIQLTWCGLDDPALILIDHEDEATAYQQVCGMCKLQRDRDMEKPTRKRATRQPVIPPPPPVAPPRGKSFRQQQAEDIAAAQARRTNGRSPAPLEVTKNVGRGSKHPGLRKMEQGIEEMNGVAAPKGRRGSPSASLPTTVKRPTQIVETRTSGKRNCTTVSEALIRQGKTNAEVWEIIRVEFNLDEKKRGYPAWYRSRMRRAGEQV